MKRSRIAVRTRGLATGAAWNLVGVAVHAASTADQLVWRARRTRQRA